MDLITYGLLNKAKANLDSPAFTGTPTAPTPLTPDNSNKLATTEFVRSVIATLKGFYLGVTTTTLVDEVTTDPNVVINGETVTAEDGNWVIASGGEEFVYSGTVWQKFGDSNWISVIGDTYKSNLIYNTHDCVIYMDGLYECQEDNVTGDWDSTKWQATTVIDLITGGIPLENLSNVDIVNPQAGNHLVFDGTKWKNSTIVSPALSELSDIELENITDGQALIYNDTTDKWENQDIPTGQVTKTATGNPIELTDAASAPLVKCVTQIQGSQDLHGQDKPWVGGAGKNKFDSTLMVNPASSAKWVQVTLKANTAYTVSSDIPNSYTSAYIFAIAGTDTSSVTSGTNGVGSGRPQYITTGEDGIISFGYRTNGASGVLDLNNYVYQIEEGSTATAYAPYSNICPITAYTEGEIEVRGKNIFSYYDYPIRNGYWDGNNVFNGNNAEVDIQHASSWQYILIPVEAGKTITASNMLASGGVNNAFLGSDDVTDIISTFRSVDVNDTRVVPNGAKYLAYCGNHFDTNYTNYPNAQIEYGSSATTYEPYTSTTHTTTYPSAIYRGSEDVVNGEVTEVLWKRTLKWGDGLYSTVLGNYTRKQFNVPSLAVCPPSELNPQLSSCAPYKAKYSEDSLHFYINDATTYALSMFLPNDTSADFEFDVVGELATPTTSSVTPTNLPIRTLSGYNHIESSTGEMEIEYITENQQPIIDLIDTKADNVDMVGAAAAASGSHGLVPAPSTGDQEKFLKGDGTWSNIPAELPSVTSTDDNKVLTVVNGSWTKANPQTGMSESVIADEYDSSETYNIADYCMHSGKLYKCNTANTTGAWNNTKWDETCVGDELTLKTAVIVAPRVDQTATYTYNGTEQTLAFEYINSNNTIVTGNKHTDAGTYTCTVSLKNPNDLWSDTMDNVDKTFTWTINKVTSSITLSPTTFYFSNGTPQTLTATVVGQPLVLSGYDTNLITITQVSVVNGVYTYSVKATGTAGTTTITASIAESTNYTAASATASVETEAFTPGATLVPWSSGTDQEITDMINSYYNGEITLEDVKSVWSIGDVRNVDISAMAATGVGESHRAQTVEMEILDFDHDTLTTPVGNITKALITVDMKNCLRDANVTDTTGSSNTEHGYMNSSNTNVGGWTSCARRTWCNNVFYNALPAYFKSLVKPVDKLTSAGNQSSIINTDSDYCFLLSEIEIFGAVTYSKAGEGNQYAWFANATANRYKLPKWNSNSVSDIWWERSPYGSFSYHFCLVDADGYARNNTASYARGLAPACCL